MPRLDRPAWLPLALATLLILGIVAQLLAAGDPQDVPTGGVTGGGRAASTRLPEPVGVPVPSVVLARSMFAPGAATATAAASGQPVSPLGGLSIAGSVRIGRAAYAVIVGPDGSSRRVPIGGRIGPWRLRSISGSAAVVQRGGERLTVPFGGQPPVQPQGSEDQ